MITPQQVDLWLVHPTTADYSRSFLWIQNTPQRHVCNSLLVCSVVGVKEFLIAELRRRFQVRV